jgi:diguanylate cyclase (GGDEF)-like protein
MPFTLDGPDEVLFSSRGDKTRIRRVAWVAVSVSFLIFLAVLPIVRMPFFPVAGFVPLYASTLVVCDLVTAALLLGQFFALKRHGLLILALAYFYTGSMTLCYILIFPGLFSPTGLFGAGPQTTSAMYMLWHAGFPLFLVAYAFAKGRARSIPWRAALVGIAAVSVLAVGLVTWAATQSGIPDLLVNNTTTPLGHALLWAVWSLSLVALSILAFRRPHSVLDVWLLVVLTVWLFDLALSALLNTGRYDVGWYMGRAYGLAGASFLLFLLLIENGRQHGRLVALSRQLTRANRELRRLSLHDGLTNLANRRSFDLFLDEQLALARRHHRPLVLLLGDVDQFKSYNDVCGHPQGDACLRSVARALQGCCRRPGDLAARYGGEEFALVLADTDEAGGRSLAESARQAVESLGLPHPQSEAGPNVTISFGMACLDAHDAPSDLLRRADAALYRAKRAGRNRVEL